MTTPDQRRERRAWIAEHHPDRGGDPAAFAAGLATFARQDAGAAGHDVPRARPTVVRSRSPFRVLRRLTRKVTRARRRRTHHGVL